MEKKYLFLEWDRFKKGKYKDINICLRVIFLRKKVKILGIMI